MRRLSFARLRILRGIIENRLRTVTNGPWNIFYDGLANNFFLFVIVNTIISNKKKLKDNRGSKDKMMKLTRPLTILRSE